MKKILIFTIIMLAIVFLNEITFAKTTIPGRTDKMVNDYAGIIDDSAKKAIEELSASIRNKSRDPVEIIVATFPSLEGWRFDDFRKEYGEKWRLTRKGSRNRDNGVIIFICLKEKRVSIGVGQNLKSILTDAIINDVIQNEILPEFKRGNFGIGIKKASEKIINILNNATIPAGNSIFNLRNLAILILLLVVFNIVKRWLHK